METRIGPRVKIAKPMNHGDANAIPAPASPRKMDLRLARCARNRKTASGISTRGRKMMSGQVQFSGTPRPSCSSWSSSVCTSRWLRWSASSGL